ncbi:uncharacterized protein EV422DRAFT_543591 [Fimicolochytrium jonesii]|uniref:uncharacterized protein n=1 Tax=Fimicolochytrium jonesii TaxID=1396493 RepID=UPI0022FDF7DD|nr:uncharacterized protein EV422DRAFT_543591 [Fimicolochytrium jonesii]KAI8816918.1 hypothetical protein EV422DRAFT_543591 [Fimicolochytrium jonesii]
MGSRPLCYSTDCVGMDSIWIATLTPWMVSVIVSCGPGSVLLAAAAARAASRFLLRCAFFGPIRFLTFFGPVPLLAAIRSSFSRFARSWRTVTSLRTSFRKPELGRFRAKDFNLLILMRANSSDPSRLIQYLSFLLRKPGSKPSPGPAQLHRFLSRS